VRAGCLPRVGPTTAQWNAVAALASAIAGVTPFPFAGRTGRAARPGPTIFHYFKTWIVLSAGSSRPIMRASSVANMIRCRLAKCIR
jgi:hypothetical protein